MAKLISIGGLIDKSWDHYRANFADLLNLSAWILVVSVIDIIALALFPKASTLLNTSASLTGAETLGVILTFVNSAVITPIVSIWILIALSLLINAQLTGKSKGQVKEAARAGLKLFWPATYILVLVFLVLVGAVLSGIAPAFIASAIFGLVNAGALFILSSLLLFIGVIVAIILSVKWGVEYVLSPYALFLENKRGPEALKRSKQLIQGRFFDAFIRMLIPKLVFALVGIIALAILVYLANILTGATAGLNLDLQLRLGTIINSIFPALIAVFINPLLVIVDVILYQNLMQGRR